MTATITKSKKTTRTARRTAPAVRPVFTVRVRLYTGEEVTKEFDEGTPDRNKRAFHHWFNRRYEPTLLAVDASRNV